VAAEWYAVGDQKNSSGAGEENIAHSRSRKDTRQVSVKVGKDLPARVDADGMHVVVGFRAGWRMI
jgi:hypothetical protein